jgi:3-methyladenine DNA glycosylase/8-oxoguanine DNA glycosylase
MRMESYRTCGFSEAKALAIIGIAKAQERGKIPSRADSATMTDEVLIASLMQLRGIGRWTVEMFRSVHALVLFVRRQPSPLPPVTVFYCFCLQEHCSFGWPAESRLVPFSWNEFYC